MTLVVNFYGGPGVGKSTMAAGVFSALKQKGINTELVREYAKDVVWEGRSHILSNQIYIFAKQLKRQSDLSGKVDVIITDSPLLLSLIYGENYSECFKNLVREEFTKFNNMNIFIRRAKEYNQAGRVQTLEEAQTIDGRIFTMLNAENQPFYTLENFSDLSINNMERGKIG